MAQAPRLELFAARLTEALRARGWKRAKLATEIGMDRANVTRWMKGDVPPLPTLIRVAQALEKDWLWLIGAEEPATAAPPTGAPHGLRPEDEAVLRGLVEGTRGIAASLEDWVNGRLESRRTPKRKSG